MISNLSGAEIFWLSLGLLGQFLFSLRFFLQWLHSEKHKKSLIPVSFWFLSVFGSISLLIYAIYRKDPVFILGQSFGILIYLRNLYWVYKPGALSHA